MGVRVDGDPRAEKLYTVQEIADATCLSRTMIYNRIKQLGIQTRKGGYTYEEVKRIKKKPKLNNRPANKSNVEQLRRQLANDGML